MYRNRTETDGVGALHRVKDELVRKEGVKQVEEGWTGDVAMWPRLEPRGGKADGGRVVPLLGVSIGGRWTRGGAKQVEGG